MKLKISKELSLPADAATSTIVAYGGKGMGKTNFGSVLAEEFDRAGIRFAVIDPMGVWWGLRHGADGKSPGVEVLILGGRHGDFPLTPEAGELAADLVVDEDANVIIDISRRADGSMWSIGERIRFVTAYVKRLYQRQGEKRRPLNQVIDEAARFAPQVVRAGDLDVAKCMGAVAVLVEEGRNVGVGVVLMTQRSARLNKDVAELADCMISFRIIGPNSMRAVLDWLGEHVEKPRLKELSEKLRSLPRGTALVVSPGWLEFEGIVEMRKRETFDSSDTPKSGKQKHASGSGAKPDLAKYRLRLADLVEQQKANDPKQLRAEVARLRKANEVLEASVERASQAALAKSGKAHAASARTVERTVKVIQDSQLTRIEKIIATGGKLVEQWDNRSADAHDALRAVHDKVEILHRGLDEALADLRDAVVSTKAPPPTPSTPAAPHGTRSGVAPPRMSAEHQASLEIARRQINGAAGVKKPPSRIHAPRASAEIVGPGGEPFKVLPAMQKILDALAALEQIGVSPAPKSQLALFASTSPTSSSYTNNLGAMRTAALLDYPTGGTVALTANGRALADAGQAPQSIDEVHAHVRKMVGETRWRILGALIEAGGPVKKTELAELSGTSPDSSSYTNNLGSLRSLKLLDYPRPGEVVATGILAGPA